MRSDGRAFIDQGSSPAKSLVVAACAGWRRRRTIAGRDPRQADLVRSIVGDVPACLPLHLNHRMAQMAREGSLYTAQAFQQMNAPRRHAVMMATLGELAITLTDAALSMFQSLVRRSARQKAA